MADGRLKQDNMPQSSDSPAHMPMQVRDAGQCLAAWLSLGRSERLFCSCSWPPQVSYQRLPDSHWPLGQTFETVQRTPQDIHLAVTAAFHKFSFLMPESPRFCKVSACVEQLCVESAPSKCTPASLSTTGRGWLGNAKVSQSSPRQN